MGFEVCAITPAGLLDPSIAIAASRAGGVGVLDLEHAMGGESAAGALATLARLGRGHLGIRLGGDAPAIARAAIERLPREVGTVILTFGALVTLGDELAALGARGARILVEVHDGDQAEAAGLAGASGLIARGLESGGFIGEETTFILLQRLLERGALPVWAHGGIGLHSAAACRAAGAAGVVLDAQLALARESALPAAAKAAIARMDGSETVTVGGEIGAPFRVFGGRGRRAVDELRQLGARLAGDRRPLAARAEEWRVAVRARVGWGERDLWPLGQDADFAAPLAARST